MSSKQIRFYLTLIISVCFAYWVYDFFSGSEALGYIIEHYSNLYLLVFAHLPSLIFDSLAWMVLMTKKKLTFYWCVIITWISQTAGKFLPTGNITGEFVRIYLSVQKGMNSVNSSSIVLADLAIATFSLLLIAIFSLSIVLGFNDDLTTFEDNYKYILFSVSLMVLASFLFCFLIRKRFIKNILKITKKNFKKKGSKFKKVYFNLLKFDFEMYKLSFNTRVIVHSLFFRLVGWLGGAFEVYIFLKIIDIEVSLVGIVLIESFTGIVRAFAFFIPAAIGIQELAFVIMGSFLGLSNPVSLSIAIGRRIREILIGVPAILSWYFIFNRKLNIN